MDLVTTNFNDNTVSIFIGNGTGTFSAAFNYVGDNYPKSVAIAALNNKGDPDLVVTNYEFHTIYMLLGNCYGIFKTVTDYDTGDDPNSVTVRDININGIPDLLIPLSRNNYFDLFLEKGDGTLQTNPLKYISKKGPVYIAVGYLAGGPWNPEYDW